MALSNPYEGSSSISTTEFSLVSGSTSLSNVTASPGVYQLWLDLSALTVSEWYELLIYETVITGGSKLIAHREQFIGVPKSPTYVAPALQLAHGFDFTLRKVQGTDRSIGWSIRMAA